MGDCDPQKFDFEVLIQQAYHLPVTVPLVPAVVKDYQEELSGIIECLLYFKQFAKHRDTQREQDTIPALRELIVHRRNT